MNMRRAAVALGFAALGMLALNQTSHANDGEEMNVHNHTGHEVLCFLFQDADVHLDEHGGVQFAHLKDGESAVAHVPHCTFSVLLIDKDDVWHAEFHDCHSTDLTFTATTGHDHHGGGHH
jgi:hypothetical protein